MAALETRLAICGFMLICVLVGCYSDDASAFTEYKCLGQAHPSQASSRDYSWKFGQAEISACLLVQAIVRPKRKAQFPEPIQNTSFEGTPFEGGHCLSVTSALKNRSRIKPCVIRPPATPAVFILFLDRQMNQ
jgi:hypothetical protein